MAESSSAPVGAPAVASDIDNLLTEFPGATTSPSAGKRSAAEAFEGDSVEDLKDAETTLDDVLVSPLAKKSKLLDEELPDVDDDEQFPRQEEDMDEDLALGLENAENTQDMEAESLNVADESLNMGNGDLNMEAQQKDVDELAPPEEEEEEESEPPTSQNNEIDIVDVDEEEEEEEEENGAAGEYQQYGGQDEEEAEEDEDEDEQETARAIARAQNQREARQLLQQLDDSARSKLCLTVLEKYGEELFYGHEDARDAILVDACAQDSVLSLMREALRVRDLYLRGSSAAAPVELDDDDDDDEEETGGYEDDDEEADDDEEKPAPSGDDDDDDEIVVISEEEEEEADSEAPNTTLSPKSEAHAGDGAHAGESDEHGEEEVDNDIEAKVLSAEEDSSDAGENETVDGEGSEETKESEDAALGDAGAADDSVPETPVADAAT